MIKIRKQEDIRDCGIAILQSFHNYFYDNWLNINKLKQLTFYGKKGVNVSGLSSVGNKFGMKLTAMKGNFTALSELKFTEPLIILIGNNQ